jgi:putative ABC transport system substrate-binding protein
VRHGSCACIVRIEVVRSDSTPLDRLPALAAELADRLYLRQVDVAPKKLQLLKEAVPSATRIAVLFDDASRAQRQIAQDVANSLGVILLPHELRGSPYDYDAALRASVGNKAEAVLILSSGAIFPGRFTLMSAIQKHRLPSMASVPFRDAGAMLCYSANFVHMYARAAEYVDRILKGHKPADTPIEQPTKFEFIVNVKTARLLGVTLPNSLLLRADEVLQ